MGYWRTLLDRKVWTPFFAKVGRVPKNRRKPPKTDVHLGQTDRNTDRNKPFSSLSRPGARPKVPPRPIAGGITPHRPFKLLQAITDARLIGPRPLRLVPN